MRLGKPVEVIDSRRPVVFIPILDPQSLNKCIPFSIPGQTGILSYAPSAYIRQIQLDIHTLNSDLHDVRHMCVYMHSS